MEKKSSTNFYIPEPCHENIARMTPMEKGRFCQSCNKKVHDFRNSTYEEINIIFKNSKGNACGIFYEDQLNQDLKYLRKDNSVLHRWKLKMVASFAALWLKVFSVNAQDVSDSLQSKNDVTIVDQKNFKYEGDQIRIRGIIKSNKFNEPMVGLKFKVYDDAGKMIYASSTDARGEFDFGISNSYEGKNLKLVTTKIKKKTSWRKYIYKSTTDTFIGQEYQQLHIGVEVDAKRKFRLRKRRVMIAGKFRD